MKKIILILALLLPIGVFVFLGIFGKNEFSIPVYYESGVDSPALSCDRTYESPYIVSASLLDTMGWKGSTVLIIVDSANSIKSGLTRLNESFHDDVQIIYPKGSTGYLDEIYSCDLFLRKPWTAVLLDDQRRIRGYYDPKTREEVDRLLVEMKILLKQY
jgi:hypothetical protein